MYDILLQSLDEEIQRVYEQMSRIDPESQEYKDILESYKILHNLRKQIMDSVRDEEKVQAENRRIENEYVVENLKIDAETRRRTMDEKKLEQDTKSHKTEMIFDGCKIALSFVSVTIVPVFLSMLAFGADTSLNMVNGRIVSEIGKSYKNLLLFKS